MNKSVIESLLQKKHWAFTIFYNETVDGFFSYLKSNFYLTDWEIHDIISHTFVKIWNKLYVFDKNKWDFMAWSRTILRNTTKDYFKKKKDLTFSDFDRNWNDDSVITLEETLPNDEDILEDLEWDYRYNQIKQAMKWLSSQEKEILFLRFNQGKSLKEVANIILISEANVRVKIHRILNKLKKILKNL